MDFKKFRNIAHQLYLEANYRIRPDIRRALKKAYLKEERKLAKEAIKIILENAFWAFREKVPLCQDTGYPIFFIKLGRIGDKEISRIQQELTRGIEEATTEGFLRSSLVLNPLKRKKITPNIPPIFHLEFSDLRGIEIELLVKGFGSENQTQLYLLNPSVSEDEIVKRVVEQVKRAGSRACPPYIIGIGVGGTSEMALILSKKATLLEIDKRSKETQLAKLERKIKKEVNRLGIGPLGVGGKTTALGVRIITHPTHIAGLPLGVSLGCHATRSAKKVIK